MTNRDRLIIACLIPLLTLAGCASRSPSDGGPRTGSVSPPDLPGDPVPRKEARSRYGNGPVYEVYGTRYHVLPSNYGYQERGVASWYGKKFHGRPTSSQERYDMYAMTAAHKTLPLPSFVEVRNLRNSKTVIVRVNDRGPFVDNRIIDLSYSAAVRLDMIGTGTSLVEVTAISFDKPPASTSAVRTVTSSTTSTSSDTSLDTPEKSDNIYVQVGAFGDRSNARRRFSLLRDSGISPAFVQEEKDRSPALYRVRIGPIADVDQYDIVVAKLEKIGITESHIVTE